MMVMECTFGRPRYRFPAAEVLREDILGFCRNTMAEKSIPVLLAYLIGKAQDLRKLGIEAWALGGGNQLELPL